MIMLWDDKCGVGSSSVCLDRLFEKYCIAAGVKSGLKEVYATVCHITSLNLHAQQTSFLTSLQSAFYVMSSESKEKNTQNTSTSK